MADYSKREISSQGVVRVLKHQLTKLSEGVRCHCGKAARYEVNCGASAVTFVCEEHLPQNF